MRRLSPYDNGDMVAADAPVVDGRRRGLRKTIHFPLSVVAACGLLRHGAQECRMGLLLRCIACKEAAALIVLFR